MPYSPCNDGGFWGFKYFAASFFLAGKSGNMDGHLMNDRLTVLHHIRKKWIKYKWNKQFSFFPGIGMRREYYLYAIFKY
jgi:hypothetical protein